MNCTLTRAKLDQLCERLVERTKEPCRKALADANLKTADIDEVILVGGMTRMPAVIEKVKSLFGKDPHRGVNPDEVVAVGAAIQGGVIAGDVKSVLLLDVTPLSLGIETLGGVFTKLIERNTTIPVSKKEVFSTAEDNQTAVTVHVLQGEREMASGNRTLGRFNLEGIPPAPRGLPQVEVAFDIDADGILHVSAKDRATNKEQRIRIEASSGLNETDVQRMVREAEQHAAEDKRNREEIEERNKADHLLYTTEAMLREHSDKLDSGARANLESALDGLRDALKRNDPDGIRNASTAVTRASHNAAETLYRQAAPDGQTQAGCCAGNPGRGTCDSQRPYDDHTVDADFTVVNNN